MLPSFRNDFSGSFTKKTDSLARTNFQYEKRRRELAKKKKKEEKLLKKRTRSKEDEDDDLPEGDDVDSPGDDSEE
jgi:hypothetical protein